MKKFLLPFVACIVFFIEPALAIETTAKQAFMIDLSTHTVLLDKNGEEQMHPSSMSKLMTVYILFTRIKQGRVKLTDKFTISKKAWETQGSKTFVGIGEEITVEDLIHGIITQSGNDACIVVAEGLSGSEEAFVKEMNRVAKEMGLTKTNFDNATGLPDDKHLMSAHDLATLAERIMTDFPEFYPFFSVKEYTYHNIKQQNRNRLLGGNLNVDGLKTGHTDAGGFGITLSAKQGNRRLILVINGLETDNDRVEEGDKLLRWGFREFENKTLVHKGQKIDEANVWFGRQQKVSLVADKDITLTLPITPEAIDMKVKYVSPVPAPVAKGAHIADLEIKVPGGDARTLPLMAGQQVDKLGPFRRLYAMFDYFVLHHQPQ